MGTKSTLNAKNLRDQLKRILNYIRDNLRFVETDLSVGGDVELSKTLNVKPSGNSVFAVSESQVVINETGNDVDFRVESDSTTHAFFVDGGNDLIRIDAGQGIHLKDLGTHADTPVSGFGAIYVNGDVPYFKTDGGTATSMIASSGASAPLTLTNSSTAGSAALTIDNNDTDQIALSIDAANIDADVIDIAADAVTTAFVMDVTADALTTGGILNLVSDSSSTSARSLVTIKNDNTAATATTLLHLINDSTSASADMILESTDADAAAAPVIEFLRASGSPAVDDIMGKILFNGKDDGGNTTLYASIRAEINDETDSGGQEDGVIVFDIIKNNSQKSALELKNNEAVFNNGGADIDFRIESDDETHMLFVEGSTNRISIGDSTDGPAGTLEVTNHASAGATGAPLVQLNSNDVDQIALDINAANTTANVIDIQADALTTGIGVNIVSNSSDNGARSLVFVHNDHASATDTACVKIVQDAASTTALRINSDNTETNFGPIVVLDRQNDTVSDGMGVGLINFEGQTDEPAGTGYARISAVATDVSAATPRGKLILRAQLGLTGATEPNAVEELMSLGGGTGSDAAEVVINDLSYDVDFRVESNDETHMLFVDGGNNRVSIGDSTDAPTATLEVTNHASAGATGVPLVQLNSNDIDKIAVDINAANTTADVIDITADAVTTAFVMDVSADALTTGGILHLVSDSSDGSNQRSLVKIHNDNTAAVQVTSFNITNDAAGTRQDVLINTATTTGDVFDINCDSLTTGNTIDVSADGLTTGGILNLVSDSSDTSARTLVTVKNDNTAAVGTVVMHLINDAIGGLDDPILLIESTSDETHPVLELRNSNASTTGEPILLFNRSDTSAEADDMKLGQIQFKGVDSGNNNTFYAQIKADATDITAGDEGGEIKFIVMAGGTAGTAAVKELLTIGGEDVANAVVPAVIVNEAGINCDFRVESDGEDEAIFLDASAETLYINKGESAFTTQIHNTNDVAMTVDANGITFNEDGHSSNDFRVESQNNTHMLYVDAAADTVTIGGDTGLHRDGFAVINDFNTTTFENLFPDGNFGSAEILRYSPGADDTLTAGQLFFLHTDGTWDSTDADAVATGATQMLGIGLGGSARTVGCLTKGFIRIPSTEILNLPGSGAVDGLPLYVSTTAGHLDFTAPSGNNDFVRIVGYAIDDDSSDVLVYFNPDATHVEITA